MSTLDGYLPFTVVMKAINRLEFQGILNLAGDKEQVVELITQELIQAGVLKEYINIDRPYPKNIHNTLEEFITEGGQVIFIHKMEFDAKQGVFTLDLKFNPESDQINKTLIFQSVQDFEEIVDEEDCTPDYIDSIIGLDQYSTKYVLKTEVHEIVFSSLVAPEILPLRNDKLAL